MKRLITLSLLGLALASSFISNAQNGIIFTVAGNGSGGYTGDGGPATAAQINTGATRGVATDAAGNIYFCDIANNVIRKVSLAGIITTIAGNGTSGFSGDGGPATLASMQTPGDVVVDAAGNIYFADANNFRIRKINTTGIITTVAGNGSPFLSGDGGPATAAGLWPAGLAVDNAGNIYVSEGTHYVIRKINTSGIISTYAGTGMSGYSGDGGPATAANLQPGYGITVDAAGNVYNNMGSSYIRKINTAGIISTYAGSATPGFSGDGGPALSATFDAIAGIFADQFGNLLVTDGNNNRIRKITPSGYVTTIAGSGIGGCSGVDGLPALTQPTRQPQGVCTDPVGNVLYIDNYCQRVRRVTNPADIVADSFSVYLNRLCAGPEFTVVIPHAVTGYSVKTYYGDGSSTLNAIPGTFVSFTHTYQTSGTYTVRHVLYHGITAVDSVHYSFQYVFCVSFPISFYYDANGNCAKDTTGEPYINRPVVAAVDSNGVTIDTIPATTGAYYYANGSIGDVYRFRIISAPAGMYTTCSSAVLDTLGTSPYNSPTRQVGLNCSPGISSFDLVQNTSTQTGRHMQQGILMVNNNFCTPEHAHVTLIFSNKYNFESSIPAPASITGNMATWDLSGVTSYAANVNNIFYTLSVPSVWIAPGDTANSGATTGPTVGDVNASNNTGNWTDTIKVSFDPNEMLVSPSGYILSGTQLQYTINFENTGNDTAFNIYVMDTLSDNVAPGSLRIVGASANMTTSKYKAGGHTIVKFEFPNINLLDSSHHNQCNGTVIFTVNANAGLPDGTTIFNHAGIFFDNNPVVMTNTVEDIIGIPTLSTTTTGAPDKLSIYPNPAYDHLIIGMNKQTYNHAVVSNSLGQVLITQTLNSLQTTIDINTLPAGVYYITLRGEGGSKVQKFVKM